MKEFRETERSVSMNWQVCGRKKFMVGVIMNGQPVKLSENGSDVVSFLFLHFMTVLAAALCAACRRLTCVWGKPARRLLQ